MVNILNELHDRNIISDIMFNKCIPYPSLLYSIIVNHNGTIGIQLVKNKGTLKSPLFYLLVIDTLTTTSPPRGK